MLIGCRGRQRTSTIQCGASSDCESTIARKEKTGNFVQPIREVLVLVLASTMPKRKAPRQKRCVIPSVKDLHQLLHDRHASKACKFPLVLNLKKFNPSPEAVEALCAGLCGHLPPFVSQSSVPGRTNKSTVMPEDFLSQVTAINLASAKFEPGCSAALVEALRRNHAVTTVNITSSELLPAPRTSEALCGYAARNELIRLEQEGVADSVRSLNKRNIGDAGAIIVARYLQGFVEPDALRNPPPQIRVATPLVHLGLAKNNIGDAGRQALLEALTSGSPQTRHIERVEVYCNAPSAQWGHFAGELLSKNSRIVSIDIGSNAIGDEGTCILSKFLETGNCRSVREIHLDFNEITAAGISRLWQGIRQCPALARLWLHGNDEIPAELNDGIEECLSSNRDSLLRGNLEPDAFRRNVVNELAERASCIVAASTAVNSAREPERSPNPKRHVPDAVAQTVIDGFRAFCPKGYGGVAGAGGRMVIAGFVLENPNGAMTLVSLGCGTRFMNSDVVAQEAQNKTMTSPLASPVVKDSHAEVLARRGLIRYLHAIIFAMQKKMCDPSSPNLLPLQTSSSAAKFQWNAAFQLHFYTSTAPCGRASMDVTAGVPADSILAKARGGGSLGTCEPWTPGQRKSCTDKINAWNRGGWQSRELAEIVGKIRPVSMTIGLKYTEHCQTVLRCPDLAVCATKVRFETRDTASTNSLEADASTMAAVQSMQTKTGNSDACFLWSLGDPSTMHIHDGRTGLRLDGSMSVACSRVLALERAAIPL